ncbi:MAG: hypothetical protein AAF541_04550 [Pseudomonadota bacterium]
MWGEYAVLEGAPAAVVALNRFAQVQLTMTSNAAGWRVSSEGFASPALHTYSPKPINLPCAHMLNSVLEAWQIQDYPKPFSIHTDTSSFHDAGIKLGIGSSAAVCCATYLGMAQMLGKKPQLSQAIKIHQAFQGGRGSGLDVAASWHGGMIRFQDGIATGSAWNKALAWMPVWTGVSASTFDHLGVFKNWLEKKQTRALTTLADCSVSLFDELNFENLHAYIDALNQLDQEAGIGIYSRSHQTLAQIADEFGLLYKPCGAGGGDLGIAIAQGSVPAEFVTRVHQSGFATPALEISQHGVRVH